jgi:TPR repeat protein
VNISFPFRAKAAGLMTSLVILGAAGCVHAPRPDFQTVMAAAQRGNARAEYSLAKKYEHGDGVPQDYATAAGWLRKSADHGFVFAQTDLGSYYARGVGVKQDYQQAMQWYRHAAGDPLAQYCIGYAYAHGDGVPKDLNEAVRWWQKAAGRGQVEAQNALGHLYFQGAFAGETNHIDYAQSVHWLGKAAARGYVPSMKNLGFLYQNGLGVQKNLSEAARWYRAAAEKAEPKAQANLGLMYQDGTGVAADKVEAYKWFALSAEHGDVVGKRFFDDYNEHRRLTAEQLAQAKRSITEFKRERRTDEAAR